MASNEEIKANVFRLQNVNATPEDIESYVKLATQESGIQPTFQSVAPPKSIFKTVGNIGTSIGDAATNLLFPKTFQRSLQGAAFQSPQEYRQDVLTGKRPSDLQAAGGALQGAAGFATLATGAPARFGARVAQSAALGAGFGAGGALESGGSVTKGTLTGAALGGAIPVAGAAIAKIAKLATENLPKWLIGTLQPEKDITQHVLQNTKLGSTKTLIETAKKNINNLDNEIKSILSSGKYENTFISKDTLLKSVAQSFGQTGGGGTLNSEQVEKIVLKVAPQAKGLLSRETLSISDANRLRKIVDRTLGAKFYLQSQAPFNKEVLGNFNGFLRNWVKNKAPESGPLFTEESKNITFRKALQKTQKKLGKVGLYEIASALGGFGLGGIPGAVGGVALEKTLRSPATAIGAAKLFNVAGKAKPAIQKLTPALRFGLLKGIGGNNPQ